MLSDLLKALMRMWLSAKETPFGVNADTAIKSYSDTLISGRYDPAAALASIDRFAERQEWPDLQTLLRSLPLPGPKRIEQRDHEADADLDPRDFADRLKMLGIGTACLAELGMRQWGRVADRHRDLSDSELIDAMERLRRGYAPFPDAVYRLTDVAGFRAAMAQVRAGAVQGEMRAALLRWGEDIEARNGLVAP